MKCLNKQRVVSMSEGLALASFTSFGKNWSHKPLLNREQLSCVMTQGRAPSSSTDSTGLLLPPTHRTTTPDRPRIVAVDVMRGVVMSIMLIVDVCGKAVPSIGHAPWNGLHLADIVMPGFIFVVGTSVSLASSPPSTSRVISRCGKLILLGILIQGRWLPRIDTLTVGLDLYTFRAPGILQRIAVCYAAAVLLAKLVSDLSPNDTVKGALKNNSRVLVVGLLCIVINWAIMLLGPQPKGCPRGSLTPQCNVASNIDRMVFGPEHMYNPLWDPEGLLSTLPSLATVALGLACGKFIQSRPSHTELLRLVGCGLLLDLCGMGLGIVIPVSKVLWTPSYCLLTGGICVAFLGIVSSRVGGNVVLAPFKWLGMNAISFFCLSDCSGLFSCLLGSIYVADPTTGNVLYVLTKGYTQAPVMLTYALLQLGLWMWICRWLSMQGIFVTI